MASDGSHGMPSQDESTTWHSLLSLAARVFVLFFCTKRRLLPPPSRSAQEHPGLHFLYGVLGCVVHAVCAEVVPVPGESLLNPGSLYTYTKLVCDLVVDKDDEQRR